MLTLSASSGSAGELFVTACRAVLDRGQRLTSRGASTQEIIGVHLRLTDPRRRFVALPAAHLLNPAFAAAVTAWILSGSSDTWISSYRPRLAGSADPGTQLGTYGPRLRHWCGVIDQLDRVRTLLQADPHTRRAVIQMYDPARDHDARRDVPCTLSYRFLLRGGRLDMHTTMRGQELWLDFPCDIFVATVLHELMAGWVGARLGTYHHHIDSLYLHADHLPVAHTLPRTVRPSTRMADLTNQWNGFDDLLQRVIVGQEFRHPGWSEFGAVMRSYRAWRAGDCDAARALARQTSNVGVLGRALADWYAHLEPPPPPTRWPDPAATAVPLAAPPRGGGA
jgi:thymidylate synthase